MPNAALDQSLLEAISHHNAGHAEEAEKLYRAILATPPGHAVASYGFGLLCATQDRLPEAIDAYRDAIAMRPDFVDAYINLGTAVLALGQPDDAIKLFQQAIVINPENAMARGNLGKALQDQGRVEEAIAAYRAALALEPNNAAVLVNLGSALLARQDWDYSLTMTRRAIALAPANAMAHANLGTALMNLGQHDAALAACRHAVTLGPLGAVANASLGGAMLELGAFEEAESLCRHAIALDAKNPDSHFNLSHALKATNRLEQAALAAREALARCPDEANYHFHLAHILLLQGDYEAGWAEYDWRWKLPDFAWIVDRHGAFPQPCWTGEDIRDKTILVHTEQGLGDIILFARYLPLLVAMARQVIAAVHPSTIRLLASIDGLTIVSIHDVPLPGFDVHCPLLSLPRAFATRLGSIPADTPYLHADAEDRTRWSQRMGDGFRVGVVWAGNPATKRDRFRSPGLDSIAPLFSVPGVTFVALQVGARDATPLPPNVLDLGSEVTDLADTAAIMSGLDLMISSCTAPLHLAAALGVPTWAILPFAPYFPWLLDRTDTPWYPTMTLYRQDNPGTDWSGVVGRVAGDLTAKARAGGQHSTRDRKPSLPHIIEIASNQATGDFNELARCRPGLMLYNRNDTYIGASLRKYGEFSGEETILFDVIVQPGRTVLDVGANIGVHTIDLSRLAGPSGIVHAFEPQRLTYQTLCANIALNSRRNVFAHHAAVGEFNGTLLVPALNPDERHNYGGVSLLEQLPGERVPILTIDSLDLADCQFIKIDVEGMETEAVRGAAETIRKFRPVLYVENDRQHRSAHLIALLQKYRYRLYWHLPSIYTANNFRSDTENIFGAKVSVNMICIPAEVPQSTLTNFREVTGPEDSVIQW